MKQFSAVRILLPRGHLAVSGEDVFLVVWEVSQLGTDTADIWRVETSDDAKQSLRHRRGHTTKNGLVSNVNAAIWRNPALTQNPSIFKAHTHQPQAVLITISARSLQISSTTGLAQCWMPWGMLYGRSRRWSLGAWGYKVLQRCLKNP